MSESVINIPSSSLRRWQAAAACLLLAAITLAVFGQTAGFEFVNFDDDIYVYENARIAGGLNLENFSWFLTHPFFNLYHPLTMLSLAADHQLYGLHAGGYHLTNVLLHTASVILLFLVLREMTGAFWRSAFVAAVFGVHPLRVESVAWVAERKDVLSVFFFMLTLAAYVRYTRKPDSPARYWMVALAFLLALLSKLSVVTLPFVLLLLDYWPLHRFEPSGSFPQPRFLGIPRRLVLEKIPLLVLALAMSAVTYLTAAKLLADFDKLSLSARLGNALVSYVLYLRQMIWPVGLAPFYSPPENGCPVWMIVLSCLLLFLITAGVLFYGRQRRWLLTGWFWYVGTLVPMIGIVQIDTVAHADRFTYLPQIGVYMAVTWLVAEWGAKRGLGRAAWLGLSTTVVAILMVCAWKQTSYWRNSKTLWPHTIACAPDNEVAYYNLGTYFMEKGDLDQAISNYQTAARLQPSYPNVQNNLGSVLLRKGRVDEAIPHLQKALEVRPKYASGHLNLGDALLQKGSLDEAVAQFKTTLAINPACMEADYNLGSVLLQQGKVDEAIPYLDKALQSDPGNAAARVKLGDILMQQGKLAQAVAYYKQALGIQPDFTVAHKNLGICSYRLGRMDEAILHYQKALQLEPADSGVQNNLAWLLATCPVASLRNGKEAVELAQKSNETSGGKNPIILHTLAAALAEAGRFGDAAESAQKAVEVARAAGQLDLATNLESELKRYQAGLPLHQ